MKIKKPLFVRKDVKKKLRFKKKKKLKWRRQKGRHSKIRQKRKGYTRMPTIGFGSPKKTRDLINGQKPILINNANDLEKIDVKQNQAIIIVHTSKKNKIAIAKKAQEMKIKIKNLNIKKILKQEKVKEKKIAETENKK
jgi:large subunit ribosomal protein L32e